MKQACLFYGFHCIINLQLDAMFNDHRFQPIEQQGAGYWGFEATDNVLFSGHQCPHTHARLNCCLYIHMGWGYLFTMCTHRTLNDDDGAQTGALEAMMCQKR